MKRYVLAGLLAFGLLLTSNPLILAQDDADDVDEDVEETEDVEVDEDQDEADKGTRRNPYAIAEVGEVLMRIESYVNVFNVTADGESAPESTSQMNEGEGSSDAVTSEADMMMYPNYSSRASDEIANLEFTQVIRGDEVLDELSGRNFYHYGYIPENLEWALIDFTFEWVDSDYEGSMHLMMDAFTVFDQTGASVFNNIYDMSFDGSFNSAELYAGGVVNGQILRLVPIDEPFMIRFGDNYQIKHTFFSFE